MQKNSPFVLDGNNADGIKIEGVRVDAPAKFDGDNGIQKWLEPAIELRIAEAVDICDDETTELYNELWGLLKQLTSMAPETYEISTKIEDVFNFNTNITARKAYRIGFDDGLFIGKQLR
ncbi:hypothetical protein ABE237_22555 [Brevibacillus formosus]|uniref:hypothetical protein n=1 Tax=Brevibacillus formosus TaxID=54913 RepID=UPI0018CFB11E|nr:hypothetical protein [Brevibacillus formosus]MBG9941769.1 hypothetical protein [Brevibacillus formosus]